MERLIRVFIADASPDTLELLRAALEQDGDVAVVGLARSGDEALRRFPGSGADFLKSYTLRYAKALRTQGHPCELLYEPEGKDLTHAYPTLRPEKPESQAALDRILTWMQELG